MSNLSISSPELYQSPLNRQRKDKFFMVFTLPEVLKNYKSKVQRSNSRVIPDSLQFSIYGLTVPEIKVPEKQIPYAGHVLKVSSFTRPSFDPLTVSFMVDNQFNNYWVIYKWLNILNDHRKSIYNSTIENDTGYLDEYMTNITVYGVDEYNNRTIQFNYTNAFPTGLGGIKYSDRDPGELESSFQYSFFQFEPLLR
jgi:hypothetical protein